MNTTASLPGSSHTTVLCYQPLTRSTASLEKDEHFGRDLADKDDSTAKATRGLEDAKTAMMIVPDLGVPRA